MFGKNKVSMFARRFIADENKLKEILMDEQETLKLMTKIFREHFSNLRTQLKSYNIKNKEQRKMIMGWVENMRNDCKAFKKIKEHPELVVLADKLLGILTELLEHLRNRGYYRSNTDFIPLVENQITEYYNLLNDDLKKIFDEDKALLGVVVEKERRRAA